MITRYSTDVEDFCVSVEFSAVSAVSAVKILLLYILKCDFCDLWKIAKKSLIHNQKKDSVLVQFSFRHTNFHY